MSWQPDSFTSMWTSNERTGQGADPTKAPATAALLRRLLPDAVELAETGAGEVIFSALAPHTEIAPHCAPTNLRLTLHLGLVVPPKAAGTLGRVICMVCVVPVFVCAHMQAEGWVLVLVDAGACVCTHAGGRVGACACMCACA
jgi:hypothetical protein